MRVSLARWITALLVLAVAGVIATPVLAAERTSTRTREGFVQERLSSPSRTRVTRSGRWVATFTEGARTVTLAGPSRTFAERTASDSVTTRTWVRLLSSPFTGTLDKVWLGNALKNTSPDVLAMSMEYIEGARDVNDSAGFRVAGDADYGPLQADGTRKEGSDFNDYIGTDWSYGDTTDPREADEIGSLDCSGFMRMLFGYRNGFPLTVDPDGGASLPRRSFQMYESAPGVVTIQNTGAQVIDFDQLARGDLVFFDAASDDGVRIDHVGMYLGPDSAGSHRFISSRKSINGPTLGDYRGRSTLNGTGLYATAFRAARRL